MKLSLFSLELFGKLSLHLLTVQGKVPFGQYYLFFSCLTIFQRISFSRENLAFRYEILRTASGNFKQKGISEGFGVSHRTIYQKMRIILKIFRQ